jgi:transcriptional regulator with XRE-family HTH domain
MRETEWRETVRMLGQHIRTARQLVGWSQETLADRSSTSQGTVSRIERGAAGDVQLICTFKLLIALGTVAPDVNGALSPSLGALFECAQRLVETPPTEPASEPAFADLLRAYHALSPGKRAAFCRITRPIIAMLADS